MVSKNGTFKSENIGDMFVISMHGLFIGTYDTVDGAIAVNNTPLNIPRLRELADFLEALNEKNGSNANG